MTSLLLILALGSFIAWQARWPSEALFDEADTYYRAADNWGRRADEMRAVADKLSFRDRMRMNVDITELSWKRLDCLERGHALARKAIRRMPWRLL